MWKQLLCNRAIVAASPSLTRSVSTSSVCHGKRNFRKFILPRRGHRQFNEAKDRGESVANYGPMPGGPREPYVVDQEQNRTFVPEMVPEFIVPDLKDCQLKPYVSYRVPDVFQSEFTAEQLFNAIYKRKIVEDFKNNRLGPDGQPLQPSPEESLTPEEAYLKGRKTGSDIF